MAKITKETAKKLGAKGGRNKKGHKAAHTLEAEAARAALIAGIHELMPQILAAWADKALGHYEEREIIPGSGVVKIYKKAPDANAIRDMLDRAMGKPVQPISAKVEDGVDLTEENAKALEELNKALNDNRRQRNQNVAGGTGKGQG